MESVRLQKYFTDCAILSRRAAEDKIRAGEVKVNGEVATLGQKIDPERDVVEYNGKIIKPTLTQKHYVLLYKPRGVVTTLSDEKGRTTVAHLVADLGVRVYPVGRLDMDSDGLLLLTDDGALTERLTHPRHEIPKHYHVTVAGVVTPAQLAALNSSFLLDGYTTRPAKVSVVRAESGETVLAFELYEGRNRQIRRMCDQVGLRVRRLSRIAIGKIGIGDLVPGRYRLLTEEEIAYLRGEEAKTEKTEKAAKKTRSTSTTRKKKAPAQTAAATPADKTDEPQTPEAVAKSSMKAATEMVWDALSMKYVDKAMKDILNATMKPLTKRTSKPKAEKNTEEGEAPKTAPKKKSTRQTKPSATTRTKKSTTTRTKKSTTSTSKKKTEEDKA